jgi:hypothetical protein
MGDVTVQTYYEHRPLLQIIPILDVRPYSQKKSADVSEKLTASTLNIVQYVKQEVTEMLVDFQGSHGIYAIQKLTSGIISARIDFALVNLVNHVRWFPLTTAWRVLRSRMQKRPPSMEGNCEYIE